MNIIVIGAGVKLIQRYFKNTPICYVSNPEFLREGQAIEDWYHPSRIVIGANDRQAVDKISQLYSGIDAPIFITDITSAETIKYAANAFLVTKISFINEIANFCEAVDANIDDVAKGMAKVALYDPREDSPTKGLVNKFFIGEDNPVLIHIPEKVLHGFEAYGSQPTYVVNTVTRPYNHRSPMNSASTPLTTIFPMTGP